MSTDTPELLKNRYQLEERLGEGGMATTFLALDLRTNRRVVVKRPKPVDTFKERFVREISQHAQLRHNNIIEVLDCDLSPELPYAVLEYAEKGHITKHLSTAALSVRINWIVQILTGMLYIHTQNNVHRDISPENILLTEDGVVKISDFGLCVPVDRSKEIFLTVMGETGGKQPYMSPEHYTNFSEVDWRADIYSLGVLFYFILSQGRLPTYKVIGDSTIPSHLMHSYELVVDAAATSRLRADLRVPPIFDEIILDHMLRHEKEERTLTARRIIEALEPIISAPNEEKRILDVLSRGALKCLEEMSSGGQGIWGFMGGTEEGHGAMELEDYGLVSVEEEWLDTERGGDLQLLVTLEPVAKSMYTWWHCKFR